MGKKIVTQIKTSDYDKLEKSRVIELTVEASGRKPMRIFAVKYSLKENTDGIHRTVKDIYETMTDEQKKAVNAIIGYIPNNDINYSNYENASFNGESN